MNVDNLIRKGRQTRQMTMDREGMRRANLAVILKEIVLSGPISRAQLTKLTALNKATVTNLTDELLETNWIRMSGTNRGPVGRPQELLSPNPAKGVIVGAEINVDHVKVLVSDLSGRERIVSKVERVLGAMTFGESIQLVGDTIRAALNELGLSPSSVLGIGLAVPGVVDEKKQLLVAANLGWRRQDVQRLLRAELRDLIHPNVIIAIDNEANLAAIGEQVYGPLGSLENFIYLSGGPGIGAGVMVNGHILRGAHGAAGEVGHITVQPDGPQCECGKKGCWQVYVGRDTLARRYTERLRIAGREAAGALTHLDIRSRSRAGDENAAESMRTLGHYLSVGLGNLVEMYDPAAIVLGGFFAEIYDDDFAELKAEFVDWLMDSFGRNVDLRSPVKGQNAAVWGAAGVITGLLLEDPRS
ncbi:putative NBD/HSP70 family sugar kinase [Rhizobium sp. BK376]|nr:putative NBD/HSP70 family sugar kinase [Rhizobium sp. BK376]